MHIYVIVMQINIIVTQILALLTLISLRLLGRTLMCLAVVGKSTILPVPHPLKETNDMWVLHKAKVQLDSLNIRWDDNNNSV